MFLETIATEGLSQLSYVLGDERAGVCVVIDPRRDTEAYLQLARRHNARITGILETHIHADFVSGASELCAQTGAEIRVGRDPDGGTYNFKHIALADGDEIDIGALRLRAMHTPGHTPEHISYLLSGGKGSVEPWAVFTGDTLFAGEVGRPDLLGEGSEQKLARELYHSLFQKLLPLGDEVAVYPAHGQGSPCGGSIGDRRTSTIGYERLHNARLQFKTEDDFVRDVLCGLPPAPRYYKRVKAINREGAPVLGRVMDAASLDPQTFKRESEQPNAIIVDTRELEAFGGAHIPGALSIPLRTKEFTIWAGWMLDPSQRILLVVSDESDIEEAQLSLLRIGLENIGGYLRNGMRGWIEAALPFEQLKQMSVHELNERAPHVVAGTDSLQILDVRRADEWRAGIVPGARHIFAPHIAGHTGELDSARPVAVYCGSGYRASIAASVLKRAGFADVANVPGSMSAWKAAGYETVKPTSENAIA